MRKYCRHCKYCEYGDCFYCTRYKKVLSDKYIKNSTTCRGFELSEGDVVTGKKYNPHRKYHGKILTGQMEIEL
jgi:hypothetical protein